MSSLKEEIAKKFPWSDEGIEYYGIEWVSRHYPASSQRVIDYVNEWNARMYREGKAKIEKDRRDMNEQEIEELELKQAYWESYHFHEYIRRHPNRNTNEHTDLDVFFGK